jgi:hypothetical protein
MSNSQAIAAVTATLRSILQNAVTHDQNQDLHDTQVTILPLDKARGTNTFNQLNIFLYLVARNAAWVNADMPRQVSPGETAVPPLPLNLYYLLTAFGRDDDTAQPFGHELLGKAMSILHDYPVLSAAEIRAGAAGLTPPSDLDQQIERVRMTFQPLTIDELSKLWTGFGMQYRLSAAYEVAVTLIESTRATRTPLPVLTRGDQKDRGVDANADLTAPVPTLDTLTPPNQQPSALLNDVVALTGVHLDGTNIRVQFNHALWTGPVEVTPQAGGTATALSVQIPNQPAAWPAGFYTVAVLVQRPSENFRRATNQLTLALAPKITVTPPAAHGGRATVTVAPEVWPTQRASLLLNDNELLADPHPAQTATLTFPTTVLAAGDYWARLRVDGVDSLLVDRTQIPPVFDQTQKVTLP